jgi:predicted alpha/beta hydrolase family esterase
MAQRRWQKLPMRRQVLFIQGGGEGAHDEWDQKLVDSLARELGPNYEIRYPRMPEEADPSYSRWKEALGQEFARLPDTAILVGHSIGATILISALAEQPGVAAGGVFLLAAPFVGEGGWPSQDIKPMTDLGQRLTTRFPVYFYHGCEDDTAPFGHADLYEKAVPRAVVRRLMGRDHQLNNETAEIAADIRTHFPDHNW